MNTNRSFSTQVPAAVQARVRATVRGMQRLQGSYTLARFTTEALNEHAARLEARHHGGAPWEHDPGRLLPGARLTEGDHDDP